MAFRALRQMVPAALRQTKPAIVGAGAATLLGGIRYKQPSIADAPVTAPTEADAPTDMLTGVSLLETISTGPTTMDTASSIAELAPSPFDICWAPNTTITNPGLCPLRLGPAPLVTPSFSDAFLPGLLIFLFFLGGACAIYVWATLLRHFVRFVTGLHSPALRRYFTATYHTYSNIAFFWTIATVVLPFSGYDISEVPYWCHAIAFGAAAVYVLYQVDPEDYFDSTEFRLALTHMKLRHTSSALDSANAQVSRTSANMQRQNSTIEQMSARICDLEQENLDKERENTQLHTQIGRLQTRLRAEENAHLTTVVEAQELIKAHIIEKQELEQVIRRSDETIKEHITEKQELKQELEQKLEKVIRRADETIKSLGQIQKTTQDDLVSSLNTIQCLSIYSHDLAVAMTKMRDEFERRENALRAAYSKVMFETVLERDMMIEWIIEYGRSILADALQSKLQEVVIERPVAEVEEAEEAGELSSSHGGFKFDTSVLAAMPTSTSLPAAHEEASTKRVKSTTMPASSLSSAMQRDRRRGRPTQSKLPSWRQFSPASNEGAFSFSQLPALANFPANGFTAPTSTPSNERPSTLFGALACEATSEGESAIDFAPRSQKITVEDFHASPPTETPGSSMNSRSVTPPPASDESSASVDDDENNKLSTSAAGISDGISALLSADAQTTAQSSETPVASSSAPATGAGTRSEPPCPYKMDDEDGTRYICKNGTNCIGNWVDYDQDGKWVGKRRPQERCGMIKQAEIDKRKKDDEDDLDVRKTIESTRRKNAKKNKMCTDCYVAFKGFNN